MPTGTPCFLEVVVLRSIKVGDPQSHEKTRKAILAKDPARYEISTEVNPVKNNKTSKE